MCKCDLIELLKQWPDNLLIDSIRFNTYGEIVIEATTHEFYIYRKGNIKEDEDIYIKRTVDKDLMYLGVCILDGQTKKDIEKQLHIWDNYYKQKMQF